jgi:HAMP domain-containing protein
MEDLKGRAALVSDAAGAALVFNKPESAAEALQILKRFDDFRSAALYDAQGQLFASAVSDESFRAELPNRVSDAVTIFGKHFDYLSPITHRSASLGWVYIRADQSAAQRVLFRELLVIGVIGLVTMGLALAAIGILLSRVSRPMRNLAELMRKISETGDYRLRASLEDTAYLGQHSPASKDEVHHLARTFNSMLSQIESRDGALEKELEIRLRIQKRLDFMAHHDSLTTLPNRKVFRSHIGQACERALRTDRQVAVLFIDLDNFKGINDTMGHAIGDALLTHVASAIKSEVRSNDLHD